MNSWYSVHARSAKGIALRGLDDLSVRIELGAMEVRQHHVRGLAGQLDQCFSYCERKR